MNTSEFIIQNLLPYIRHTCTATNAVRCKCCEGVLPGTARQGRCPEAIPCFSGFCQSKGDCFAARRTLASRNDGIQRFCTVEKFGSLGIAVILDTDFTDDTDFPLDFSVKSVLSVSKKVFSRQFPETQKFRIHN